MRAYGIFPAFDLTDETDVRVQTCISAVTEIVCDRLRAGGDTSHFTIDWRDPDGAPWGVCTEGLAQAHTIPLAHLDDLTNLVRFSIDPFSGKSAGVIRSIATCRAVTFGYDGQAFLCLRHEDEPPISPDSQLLVVEERPELIAATDFFDGFVISPMQPADAIPGAHDSARLAM